MKKAIALAGAVLAIALVGCAAQPQAPVAPLMASATAEPTPSTSYEGSHASAEAEEAFLALVERDWQGEVRPSDADALAAGYEVCAAYTEEVAIDDQRFPQWSGLDNMAVHFAAGAALCPADA